MKKIFSLLLVVITNICTLNATIIVRLNPQSCSSWSTVRLWAWTSEGNLFEEWPGVVVNKDADGWYAYTFNESITSVNIIWNDGSNQTVDITNVTASTCYSLNNTSGTKITVSVVDCPINTNPGQAPISGKCGINVKWNLTNGVLAISGSGPMYEFVDCSQGAPWFPYRESIREVRIGNGVTNIGPAAFYLCTNLTSITIPNSVTSIGNHAFFACTSLPSISIPSSVTYIGDNTFENCINLPVINKIRYADTYLVQVADKTLSSYTIRTGTKWIGTYAFKDCVNMSLITIPNSVKSIGHLAFSGCTNLVSVDIPSSVTTISGSAFSDCTKLPVENNIRYAGGGAYLVEAVDKTLSSYTIKNNTKWIADAAFRYCSNLTSITIPNSVISVGDDAFVECTKLSSVTFPNSITSIGEGVFYNCNKLTSPIYNSHVFAYLPQSYSGAFSVAEGIETIASRAFWDCTRLTSVSIPNSTKSIGHFAFLNCSNMTAVNIPDGVTSIGTAAFYNCTKLTSISIPNSVTKMGWRVFRNCTNLTSVTIGDNIAYTGSETFYDCTSLSSVNIGKNVICVDESAFRNCSQLSSVKIPEGATFIGLLAFVNCNSLKSVIIPSSVSIIGDASFANCTGLTSVVNYSELPQEIVDDVFYNVNKSACTLYVPDESISLYKTANVWREFYGNIKSISEWDGNDIENVFDNTNTSKVHKVMQNGQVLILRGNKTYTLQGQEVK